MSAMRRLLIVDDNEAVRQLMVAVALQAGYEVLQAQDGAEALKVAEMNRIDLLVTDYDMPGICGTELICLLQCRGLVDHSMVVTGNCGCLTGTNPGFAVQCLMKPFTPAQFLENVRELLASPNPGAF